MRQPLAASAPAATAASTPAVSPPMSTMYLPEQIERDRISRTLPALSIVSATRNPAATLDSSINPTDFSAINQKMFRILVTCIEYQGPRISMPTPNRREVLEGGGPPPRLSYPAIRHKAPEGWRTPGRCRVDASALPFLSRRVTSSHSSFQNDLLFGDFANPTGERRVQDRAQRVRRGFADDLAGGHAVAGLHFRQARGAGALFERQHKTVRFDFLRVKRRGQVVFSHVQFARERLDGHVAAVAHRVRL